MIERENSSPRKLDSRGSRSDLDEAAWIWERRSISETEFGGGSVQTSRGTSLGIIHTAKLAENMRVRWESEEYGQYQGTSPDVSL